MPLAGLGDTPIEAYSMYHLSSLYLDYPARQVERGKGRRVPTPRFSSALMSLLKCGPPQDSNLRSRRTEVRPSSNQLRLKGALSVMWWREKDSNLRRINDRFTVC